MIHPRDRLGFLAAALATIVGLTLMVSGSSLAPDDGPALSARTRALGLGATGEAQLLTQLEAAFGSAAEPRLPAELRPALGSAERSTAEGLAAGRRLYATNCQHCHGVRGDAETATARILLPRPRDFGLGFVKYKSTPGLIPPLREDLLRVLEHGVASTSMASFAQLAEADREALVDYVQYLLMRGAVESRVASALAALQLPEQAESATEWEFRTLEAVQLATEAVAADWTHAAATVREFAVPAESAAAIARGAALYRGPRAGCVQCHGDQGDGRGVGAWDPDRGWLLRDAWGDPVRPADFRYGALHAGASPERIFRSIHDGLAGTPMPAYGTTLSEAEIADLVHYLRSLSQ